MVGSSNEVFQWLVVVGGSCGGCGGLYVVVKNPQNFFVLQISKNAQKIVMIDSHYLLFL